MSINLVRLRFAAVAAKIETTAGTDAIAGTPAAADWIAGDCQVTFNPNVSQNPELTGSFDFASGDLTIDGASGGKFSQQNRDAAAATAGQVRDITTSIAAQLGAEIGPARFTVGVGDRDGIFSTLDGTTRRYGRDDAGGAALVDDLITALVPRLTGGLTAELRTALAASGATGAQDIAGIAGFIGSVYEPLRTIAEPVDQFTARIRALTETYDAAITRARELGLAEEGLITSRDRQIAEIERERADARLAVLDRIEVRRLSAAGDVLGAEDLSFTIQAREEIAQLTESLESLGLTSAEVATQVARLTQVQELERNAARRASAQAAAAGVVGDLADFARTLQVSNDNAGNPITRLAAAQSQFDADVGAALGNDFRALSRVRQSAESLLGLSRDVNGSGAAGAEVFGRVTAALGQIGALGDDRLTASALAAEVRSQTEVLAGELRDLKAEVIALRREVQQAGRNPLAVAA